MPWWGRRTSRGRRRGESSVAEAGVTEIAATTGWTTETSGAHAQVVMTTTTPRATATLGAAALEVAATCMKAPGAITAAATT